jgi:NTE family protein
VAGLGLVLSGGGLYGAAHVGVLEVLEELDITPDFVVGTSAGALVGGLWAAGLNAARLADVTRQLGPLDLPFDWRAVSAALVRRRGLPDRVISDGPLARRLAGLVGPLTVRATPRPCWITATSLTRRRLVVFGPPFTPPPADPLHRLVSWPDDVPLVTAMRASIAVPGMFRPVVVGDDVLVDGGVLDDYPVDVALALGATRIIGVRIRERRDAHRAAPDPPHILTAAVESLSLMLEEASLLRSRLVREHFPVPTVELAVSVAGIGVTDFDRLPALMERGRDLARRHARALRELAVDNA